MKVLKQVKYGGRMHSVGSFIDVKEKDKEEMIKRGIVAAKEVHSPQTYHKPIKQGNSDLTVAEIKVQLDNKGIEYTNSMRKDELLELLRGV